MFVWFVLAYFAVDLSGDLGMPPRVVQALKGLLVLLVLLLALGLFGGRAD